MRRARSPCCARAASGHAAAIPSPAMNSRRCILDPPRLISFSLSRTGLHGNRASRLNGLVGVSGFAPCRWISFSRVALTQQGRLTQTPLHGLPTCFPNASRAIFRETSHTSHSLRHYDNTTIFMPWRPELQLGRLRTRYCNNSGCTAALDHNLTLALDSPSFGHRCLRLKYCKSGGGWSLRVGISLPSALRK